MFILTITYIGCSCTVREKSILKKRGRERNGPKNVTTKSWESVLSVIIYNMRYTRTIFNTSVCRARELVSVTIY